MSIFSKILGDPNKQLMGQLQEQVDLINALEKEMEKLTEGELRGKTLEFKKLLVDGRELDTLLAEAFAVVRESAKRTLKQRHMDTQLMGGVSLHRGNISEMKTGEGKTLSATLAVYLNALVGKGVHVITVNDYLSRRDAVWMGQIYHYLGMSVSCINNQTSFLYDPNFINEVNPKSQTLNSKQIPNSKIQNSKEEELDETRDMLGAFKIVHEFLKPCSRKEAYDADITYGTNNEYGFDYLRDSMAYDKSQVTQRGHHYAIIDEVDSILIDEARTPLIISVSDEESAELYNTFSDITPHLKEEEDYTIDLKRKAASLTEEGIEKVEKLLGVGDIYTEKGIKYVHHLNQALRAQTLFKKDRDYIVKNNEIIIVDEFTGRLMPGRRWSEGLHQAVEAKEGVAIQKESRTLASITFQNYFRMYTKLSGMTGTALTSAEEFHKVYKLEVVSIPTSRPLIRKDKPDLVYSTEEGKFRAVVDEIKRRSEEGQPVLVGTVSIEKNEYLSALLKKEGVRHRLLNAKHHEEEGEIIAQAGKKGMVTVATNMAGRGVDIVLGGNPPDKDEAEDVKKTGGLFVLGTERHEARRIDNQLRGRSGRLGDPGESRFYVSLEDSLMRVFAPEKMKSMMISMGLPEDQAIENKMVSRAIESAQTKIEGLNFDARKHILEYDDVMNKQRTKIYSMRRDLLFGDENKVDEMVGDLFEKVGEDIGKLDAKKEELGEGIFSQAKRTTLLRVIDMLWVDHLEMMDYARSSVGLRAYGNNDPLVEYKNEGIRMFRELENSISTLFVKMMLSIQKNPNVNQALPLQSKVQRPGNEPVKEKVGRNDPCPCGSGKKYKKCHGA